VGLSLQTKYPRPPMYPLLVSVLTDGWNLSGSLIEKPSERTSTIVSSMTAFFLSFQTLLFALCRFQLEAKTDREFWRHSHCQTLDLRDGRLDKLFLIPLDSKNRAGGLKGRQHSRKQQSLLLYLLLFSFGISVVRHFDALFVNFSINHIRVVLEHIADSVSYFLK